MTTSTKDTVMLYAAIGYDYELGEYEFGAFADTPEEAEAEYRGTMRGAIERVVGFLLPNKGAIKDTAVQVVDLTK